MTIQIDRTISVKDKEGRLVQVDGNESLITKSVVSLSCDGPRCQQRHGKVVSTSFVEEELKDNPEAQPASLRKFGQWKFNLAVKEFCSLECAEDILKDADKWEQTNIIRAGTKEFVQKAEAIRELVTTPEFQTALKEHDKQFDLNKFDSDLQEAHAIVQKTDTRREAINKLAQDAVDQGVYDTFVPTDEPTAEDLDLAAKNNIPGVTATVADATGFSGV